MSGVAEVQAVNTEQFSRSHDNAMNLIHRPKLVD